MKSDIIDRHSSETEIVDKPIIKSEIIDTALKTYIIDKLCVENL